MAERRPDGVVGRAPHRHEHQDVLCNEAHSLALEAIAKAHGQDRHDDLLRTDGDILHIDPLEHGTAHGGCRPDGAGDLPVIHILQMGEPVPKIS